MNYYTDGFGRMVRMPDLTKTKYPCTCKDGKVPAHLSGTPLDEVIWLDCQLCGGTGRTNINWSKHVGSGYAFEE
jgi:hypothetical protein